MLKEKLESEKLFEKRIIPSMKPFFPEEDIREFQRGSEEILKSGKLTLGKYTSDFESQFAKYIGVKHAIATNSGTSSLEAIYRAIDVSRREVVTPTNTHIATSNAVIYAGGSPVLSDIEEETLCMDADDAFSKVTENTKALVVVHIAGLIHPRVDEIAARCARESITFIEDAAHAHGAEIGGRKAGSLSDAGSFSFYPAKVMTTVEGGMITTNSDDIALAARELRNHGSDPATGLQVMLGNNWRMSELHSLLGLIQLRRVEEILREKRRVATVYEDSLRDNPLFRLIGVPKNIRHSYYKFPVALERNVNAERVRMIMKNRYGVEIGSIYYPPCHMQPIYQKLFPRGFGDLRTSEEVLKRTIALPIYAELDDSDAQFVADSLVKALRDDAAA